MEGEQRKLRVFAVGDDDQAIYAWDAARNDFIRGFEQDYNATRFVVPHSYGSPKAILDLARTLVEPLPDRLKQGTWLTVSPARTADPESGPWAAEHPELRGRCVWHRSASLQLASQRRIETAAHGFAPVPCGRRSANSPKGPFGMAARTGSRPSSVAA